MAMAEYCTNVIAEYLPSPPAPLLPPLSLQHNSILFLIYVDTLMNQIEDIVFVRKKRNQAWYPSPGNSHVRTEIMNQYKIFISQALLLFALRYLCDECLCV